MPRNNRRKSQYPKSGYERFQMELKTDAGREVAARFLATLGPKTPCIAYYRVFERLPPWPGDGPAWAIVAAPVPRPDYSVAGAMIGSCLDSSRVLVEGEPQPVVVSVPLHPSRL